MKRARLAAFIAVAAIGVTHIVASASAAATWTDKSAGVPINSLHGVSFVDANHGWAVGNGIVATTDAGATWIKQQPPTTQTLNSVDFVDASHGWAVGQVGTILATSDGGSHWTPQTSPTQGDWGSVSFTDALHGWAAGGGGSAGVAATTDGGAHWTTQSIPFAEAPVAIDFVDAGHGWVVGSNYYNTNLHGDVGTTSDGGATWTFQPLATSSPLRGVHFVDLAHGWAVGDNGTIAATSDGGNNWRIQTSGVWPSFRGVDFVDSATGWAVGDQGRIVFTADGGASWGAASASVPPATSLLAVDFVDAGHGWAAGYGSNGATVLAFADASPPTPTTTSTIPAGSDGLATATIPVTPPVRSVTVSPNAVTYGACTKGGTNLTFPNDTCTAAPAVVVTNTGGPGHIDVHGADAVPSDNGAAWTLCQGECVLRPGPDQYAESTSASGTKRYLANADACDTAFNQGDCAATANQSTAETLGLVGPASSTDASGQFTTTITWTAVP